MYCLPTDAFGFCTVALRQPEIKKTQGNLVRTLI